MSEAGSAGAGDKPAAKGAEPTTLRPSSQRLQPIPPCHPHDTPLCWLARLTHQPSASGAGHPTGAVPERA